MQYPTIYQYSESLLNSRGLFRKLEGRVRCVVRHDGHPEFYAGNFGVVFKIMLDDKPCALKVFTRHLPDREKNYTNISTYISELISNDESSRSILNRYEFYEDELFVFYDDPAQEGKYYSLIIMDWVDGRTMSWHIERAVREGNVVRLRQIEHSFRSLALWLLSMPMAHGDLKPENIMIDSQSDRMVLVDYDALYIPCMKGSIAIELGTPPYQHPMRCRLPMNHHIDDYPIAIILLALRALIHNPELWYEYQQGDNLLFDAEKIFNNTDECYNYLRDIEIVSKDPLFDVLIYKSFEIDNLADIINGNYEASNQMIHDINDDHVISDVSDINFSLPRVNYLSIPAISENEDIISLESETVVKSVSSVHVETFCAQSHSMNNCLCPISSNDCHRKPKNNDNINAENHFKLTDNSTFVEDLKPHKYDGLWGYVGSKGDWVIEPQFKQANNFYESLALVRTSSGFGFIDSSGQICIPDIYEDASSFSESMAAVCLNGKYGYIDKSGCVVVNLRYDYAGRISQGFGVVGRGGKYGYLKSDTGKIAIAAKYESAEAFSESVAVVKTNGKYGYIDTKGRWLLEPIYHYARQCRNGKVYVEECDSTIEGKYLSLV